ncbi:LysR family transcriptional regulator [Vibrio sp. JC009]|uniref:LysR family transcriptional regulator n=1 Tax=Vibrio sp. JC009 TaxID=2912314 RepID=UPI0023AF0B34|nr:LysR family transcriptional regulator [Vibrio sp. JC009]WED23798.1 LysR family transcriptional regulator [Vibrio sp. JC009]
MTPYPHIPYSHNSLKVFEAVARLMSFTLAADQLNVTQSAVSRQIKQLEDELNASLVIRRHRAIELTEKGQALYSVLLKNYQATEALIASWNEPAQKKIVIKAGLSYATRSLIPKISALSERYTDHEIVVIPAIDEEASLKSDDYDLLIFTSRNPDRFARTQGIFTLRKEYMAPVCARQLLAQNDQPGSILSLPRLHPTLDHTDWKVWLSSTGRDDRRNSRNTTFYTLDLALSACLSGQGATVTDLLLVLPEIERGFLVCPEGTEIHNSPWQYYCHQRTHSPIVDEVMEWVKEESDKEAKLLAQLAEQYNWKDCT